jgi:hypothetical protein
VNVLLLDLTKQQGWPGAYRVYRREINERAKTLKLWIRGSGGIRPIAGNGAYNSVGNSQGHSSSSR